MRNIVVFGDEKAVFARELHRSYAKLVGDGREQFGKSEDWKIERMRAEEDRIIIECAEGADPFWFSEKTCPSLRLSEDGIYQAATRVSPGMWGKAAPTNPVGMPTRAKTAAASKKRKVDVILQVIEIPKEKGAIPREELFNIGQADGYDQALELARNSGTVPKDWNIAVSESNEERIIVFAKNGVIQARERLVPKARPAVTPPKPKPKKVDLPEKLVGKNPEQAFLSKAPFPEVPAVLGQELDQRLFRCKPGPVDPLKEYEKEVVIGKDANIFEILAQTFEGTDIPADEKVRVVTKPDYNR
jgi:hypothetical protein